MEALGTTGTLSGFLRSLERVESRDEIVSFFDQVIRERDELLKRQEHLRSVTSLAEKTLADADDLAEQIKREAQENSEAEARKTLAAAEARALQITDEARARAELVIQEEVHAIRTQFEALAKEQAACVERHAREAAEQLYQQVLVGSQAAKERLDASQAELEAKLSSLLARVAQVDEHVDGQPVAAATPSAFCTDSPAA